MKKLFITLALIAFIGSMSAQNSLSWKQDGKRCSINLLTGDFSITCYDNAGNEFTVYGPNYDFEVNASSGYISYNGSGKVCSVGNTYISYNGSGKVCSVGNTYISYNGSGKVWSVGNTYISYNGSGKVWSVGSTYISYNGSGKVWSVGNAYISYNGSGNVCSISGSVK